MRSALSLLLRDPARLTRLFRQLPLRSLTPALRRSAFFLQGQMDINPRSMWYKPDFVARTGGFFPPDEAPRRTIADLEPWDCVRRDMLVLLLRSLVVRNIAGDLVELGVYRGWTARLLHAYLPERTLHLFDTFAGFDSADVAAERATTGHLAHAGEFGDTSESSVRALVGGDESQVRTYAGMFPKTFPSALRERAFAFVHLDADLYEPILAGLQTFYPLVTPGGFIVVHDYNAWPGARAAVDEFFASRPEVPVPMPDKSGSVVITKLR
jgi:O-methyltransferase